MSSLQAAKRPHSNCAATEFEASSRRQYVKDLVLGFISGMSRCDAGQLAAVLSPHVVWTIPGTSLVSGPARGVRGVWKRCQMIHAYNARLDIQRMLYGPFPGFVAAELRNTGRRRVGYQGEGVLEFDEHVMMLFHIGRDGKIQSITNFISDLDNLNTYFQ